MVSRDVEAEGIGASSVGVAASIVTTFISFVSGGAVGNSSSG